MDESTIFLITNIAAIFQAAIIAAIFLILADAIHSKAKIKIRKDYFLAGIFLYFVYKLCVFLVSLDATGNAKAAFMMFPLMILMLCGFSFYLAANDTAKELFHSWKG